MKENPLIGHTALLRLARFCPGGMLYAKAEYQNLTGSVKDRAALAILDRAESQGLLHPGSTIIEPTSGNMGISLAALSARRGYRCILVMPDTMSRERRLLMTGYGARVVLTPGTEGMQGAVEAAQALAQQIPDSFLPQQFANPANSLAHYQTTGPEIWQQTGGQIDLFVAGVGTGGTLCGVGRYLKERAPHVGLIAVEPEESPLLSAGRSGRHGIEGIGANFIPQILDLSLLDGVITVSEAQAREAARRLAQREGILAGISSGAALQAAACLAGPNCRVVTVLADSGQRYLSCKLFSETSP